MLPDIPLVICPFLGITESCYFPFRNFGELTLTVVSNLFLMYNCTFLMFALSLCVTGLSATLCIPSKFYPVLQY